MMYKILKLDEDKWTKFEFIKIFIIPNFLLDHLGVANKNFSIYCDYGFHFIFNKTEHYFMLFISVLPVIIKLWCLRW